jgi:hypothetical protein
MKLHEEDTGHNRRQTLFLLAGAAVLPAWPAMAKQVVAIDIENMLPGEYTWTPERSPSGPVAIVVSIPEQRVHVYRNGIRIAVSTCSTGRPGHETPTGVFTILQKDKNHHSSTYNNASMPNMNRLTWDGIALHAGNLPGYPASHGCVRLPLAFSEKLFTVTHRGTPVILAGGHDDPWDLIHPGLLLGQSADTELEAAVDALAARKLPGDWSEAAAAPVTTVLVSSADQSISLIENETLIRRGEVTISGDPKLGEHVLMLRQPSPDDPALAWVGLTHHLDPAAPGLPEADILNRIVVAPDFFAELEWHLHAGMVMVLSDLPSTPDRRSGADFVIMTGDALQTPRPPMPPEGSVDEG